ncbi:hypothetical protein F11_16150 [Rhodospirillum rubrum F11]|uniref:Sel1 repeat family protein n=1 Tax=Rhodospirillum rubrum (strain ATCC 11170 / ATH 1.1.1 / DSM 467 / LMG 4362 / NCIMB 8255 / S1) TaxID=269796 RepID=Q2RPJ8_RHORT|nr:hypothetical protein [Rhodospirillum rubrum]ABC23947.1 hypothetical protein Rru_A3152 [Rhodospirillum rubrum ATCC 11170]AEO49692.1 hypothetical protein F11_16150 [Rhodospirillum rubrum F11]MBK5955607.1 hypothetical protein [Rhodospirillum rubrum]QXG79891.1 hypothetical protein KUL73_16245 [Rhodospirillum rubrum]
MRVIVEQPAEMRAGHVRLLCHGVSGMETGALKVSLATLDPGGARYLDPTGEGATSWTAGEHWFAPRVVAAMDGGVSIELGPEATWHLRPHTPYVLRVGGGAGGPEETRLSWPVVRLPSQAPAPLPVVAPAKEDPVVEPTPEAPVIDDDRLTIRPERPPLYEADPPKPRRWGALIAALVVVGLAGGGVWWWFLGGLPALLETAAEPAKLETTLPAARDYLRKQPAAADALGEAKRFDAAGVADGAFLLRSYAAREGSAEAAADLGRLYDPDGFQPGPVVKMADGDRAANYYELAAKRGDVEAMTRLAKVLRSGRTSRADGPEAAVFWENAAANAPTAPVGAAKP